MTIRARIVLLVLSVLLPAFISGVVAVWFVYTEQKQAQEQSLGEAARALALLVDKELSNSESTLHALAASPDLKKGDLQSFYNYALRLAPTEDTSIVLSDLDGKQLINTQVPYGAASPDVLPQLLVQRNKTRHDQTVVSDLYFSPVRKRFGIQVQIPVTVAGKPGYYLAYSLSASHINSLILQQDFPKGWIGTIVDRSAHVISRTHDPQKFIGRQATDSLKNKILSGMPSGTNWSKTLDGIPVAAFFHRAPISKWTVILSVPQSQLRQPAINAAMLLTGLMSLLMLASLAGAKWFASRTIKPIRELERNAELLGQRNKVAHVASGIVEIDAANTALALASEEIDRNNAELEHRVAEAVKSARRAQQALLQAQKLEALGRLTGGIAHDFNNVLQTLTASLQLIRLTPDKEKIISITGICERAVARATNLISQLRAFGRVQEASLSTVNPAQAIEQALPLLKNVLPSNIEFGLDVEQPVWPVTIDPTQFELALMNLVVNARDAMPEGGKLGIRVCNDSLNELKNNLPPGEYVRITVADTGIGMMPDVLEKALEPFFTTKSVDKGSGLGLPQAYGFALQSKGDLTIESEEGAGTTVTIYLPRAFKTADLAEPTAPTTALSAGSGTVLFVEDDALVRETITDLMHQAGYKVIGANNAGEALAILESGVAVDIVFSDIVMPGSISGIELARTIQQRFASTDIILATGYSEKEIDISGVQILAKPYEADELLSLLKARMEKAIAGA
ncbi:C4-dicarboxylate-specific signal transduction histidine kinase [Paucimonas lemoignei]|uniref:histidine kinase n=1 Tax=Paucimonas lemoignei TaxID=29443 RepID=A0A4V2UJB0_PAULE|nr:ATP-binding protein [Paucimonas lemoignei]TCS39320.1 C4-dicarboxylate-specific signal transduction histidine kinase [Paucimonas lemoignei]